MQIMRVVLYETMKLQGCTMILIVELSKLEKNHGDERTALKLPVIIPPNSSAVQSCKSKRICFLHNY